MLYFINDYSEGAAPKILDAMTASNMSKQSGYGDDEFCISAKEKIKKAIGMDAEIFFVSGGTQANKIVIASVLKICSRLHSHTIRRLRYLFVDVRHTKLLKHCLFH